jgi:lipopolysaccharide transport system ATP-binding protein
MNDIAIRVEALGKQYRIGSGRGDYKMLRDTLARLVTAPIHRLRNRYSRIDNPNSDRIWALRDVSFAVERGEVIGIIGRNGAGKSTLLKILSRITEPTEGCAEINGRVGSLLEVGTGFHAELTGRENIFLNGAILGMKKAEIDKKFDQIVSFAEVEKFLDTPVKHYSSGMYVRLAFSVAAHLETESLLVDEVLAVGDLAFQKKCLGRMEEAASVGRTVLFVSHQMNQIRRLCQKAIWLDSGRLEGIGPTSEVVSTYEASIHHASLQSNREVIDSHVAARFLKWEIVEPQHERPNVLASMGAVTLRFLLKVNDPIRDGHHGIALYSSEGQLIWGTNATRIMLEKGLYEILYRLPALPLRPGTYSWRVSLFNDRGLVDDWNCIPELIVATRPVTHSRDEWAGILNIPCDFSIRSYTECNL